MRWQGLILFSFVVLLLQMVLLNNLALSPYVAPMVYIAIIAMPLFYSISEGISLGIISYVVLNVCAGKAKKVKPLMYILALLFILKYIFL